MKNPQFHMAEFERLLTRIVSGNESFYHCSAATIATLKEILHTDYPEREDDIEFLMDMVNYHMRQSGYSSAKSRFPISRHLDQLCAEPLYLSTRKEKDAVKSIP